METKKGGFDHMKSLKASDIDRMQLMRLTQYPIKMQDDLIVANELEHGILKIYKCAGGALDMHLLFADIDEWKNADLVAKITINESEQKEHIVITDVFCERGHEYLAAPMIDQAVSYAKFYESFQSVRIAEDKKERWFYDAGSVLQGFFKKGDGYYECCLEEKAKRA